MTGKCALLLIYSFFPKYFIVFILLVYQAVGFVWKFLGGLRCPISVGDGKS